MTSSTPGSIAVGPVRRGLQRWMPLAVALHGIVLAQRVAVPVVGHHDAGEARVAGEVDAEEVEDFALVEVGGGPDGGDGVDGEVVAVDAGDEADALFQRVREDMIGDLEARLGGVPVDGGDVFEEVVAGLLDGLAAATMFSRATVRVSSLRSNFASVARFGSALTAAFSGCASKTASVP